MLVAKELRRKNIVEYILYMWQIEDLIRACKMDLNNIKETILPRYNCSVQQKSEILHWYEGLTELMLAEKLEKKGHLGFLRNHVNDLNYLHLNIINNPEEKSYNEKYRFAKGAINELRERINESSINDIEVCLDGLYGYLMIRLQKKEISEATKQAMIAFSQMLNHLSQIYFEIENGKRNI